MAQTDSKSHDWTSCTLPADMLKKHEWTARFLSNPENLPVSFKVDGETVTGIPGDWKPVSRKRRIDANIIETIFEGTDTATGLNLRVECLEYLDYPVAEWVAWLTNVNDQPTKIVSDIMALDGVFQGATPVLWNCNGDFGRGEGYTAQETPMREGETLTFIPAGGRPCNQAFPYYRLMFENGGLSLAIGWPAQWSASFTAINGGVHVRAGQEKTNLRLQPGEAIRTPRLTIMSWTGNPERSANLWRRFYRAHLLPRSNGQPLRPRLAGHGSDEGVEFTAATEENQVRYQEKWIRHGIRFDTWWIDAGWYPCYGRENKREWQVTGTWTPDPERFPRGFKPISDNATRHGADLLVWFEPERVRSGTELDREHPEWLLKIEENENRLLNLGLPDCRRWLTEHVSGLIRENGIKIYRQDFNFNPLDYWRSNEPADRQGMNENLYVQGYLQYWDDLLAENPGLWIDSCASGGRRNDLETMRRSVPLHYSDFGYGNHPVKLSFHHILFEWLVYFKECTLAWDLGDKSRYDHRVDSFSCHCGLGPMFMPAIDIRRDDYDFTLLKKMIDIWSRSADLMLWGDYYPLTPIHRTPEKWVARQFDCPEHERGFIQGIRLPAAPEENLVVHPKAIVPEASYCFENLETGETRELTGRELKKNGFTFALPQREGAVWFYKKQLTEAGLRI